MASRLKNPALAYWLTIEDFSKCSFETAIEEMSRIYHDHMDVATRMKIMMDMKIKKGQSVRDYLTSKLAYMRRKTNAYDIDKVCGARFTINALFNGLPPHLKPPLVRFRTAGTVEELVEAAISLDAAMQGAWEEKAQRKYNNGNGSEVSSLARNSSKRGSTVDARRGVRPGGPRIHDPSTIKVTISGVERRDNRIPDKSPGGTPDADILRDMDGSLASRRGTPLIRLGGKMFTAGQFRTMCYAYNRCFACGGFHQLAVCPRKDDPVFPHSPGRNRKRSPGGSSKQGADENSTHQTSDRSRKSGKRASNGIYRYYDSEEETDEDSSEQEEEEDNFPVTVDELSHFYATLPEGNAYYNEKGEAFSCEVATLEVVSAASTVIESRSDELPVFVPNPPNDRAKEGNLGPFCEGEKSVEAVTKISSIPPSTGKTEDSSSAMLVSSDNNFFWEGNGRCNS